MKRFVRSGRAELCVEDSATDAAKTGDPIVCLHAGVLMGCSQGGRLALDAALAHPDRVSALVLVACSVSGALRELFLDMNGMALAAPDAGEVTEPPSAWDRLDQIRVPTLIAWGSLDVLHCGPRMRVLAQRIPNAQSFVMDDAAHLPGRENPAVFNPSAAGFLASIR
jgi:pimeloyl-ACP methyl ester carboxylesterase